ncbi:putative pre-rRNA-processing protein TSR1-like [Apostichopus japonicus]|uniref:Putative pre-rRNA-processing protein TSR1-like n=1 Tax=Stichopus japonicus TaxID=307972 RepID=A0A2G8KW03_STIJA|nr:putative pre-rRNA-processing protein TSR1-like [Apostichopus japonicus]
MKKKLRIQNGSWAETHRAGPLKQKNKSHKTGRHRSKGQIDNVMKGRANVKVLSKHMRKQQKKADRRNQAIQRRKKHREELLTHKRSIGGKDTAPHLVLVVSLHTELDAQKVLQKLIGCEDENQLHEGSKDGIFNVSVTKFKQRFTFVLPPANLSAILDTAKVADSVLGLMPPTEAWMTGESCVCLVYLPKGCLPQQLQHRFTYSNSYKTGLPTTTVIKQGLADVPAKKRNEIRKALNKAVERRFPDSKFFSCDSDQEAQNLLRHICHQKIKPLKWREPRPHMLVERSEFVPHEDSESVGTLKVTGFLRGPPLSVNGLVHLTGLGDFQMQQIDASPDLCPLLQHTKTKTAKKEATIMEEGDAVSLQMEEDITVLEKVDASRQESLETEAVVDPMEGETNMADTGGTGGSRWNPKRSLIGLSKPQADRTSNKEKESVVKKVPKGTSDYQAMWIIESDQEEGSGDEDDDDDDDDDDDEMAAQDVDTDEDETASVAKTDNMETMSITSEIKANYDVHSMKRLNLKCESQSSRF